MWLPPRKGNPNPNPHETHNGTELGPVQDEGMETRHAGRQQVDCPAQGPGLCDPRLPPSASPPFHVSSWPTLRPCAPGPA